MFYGIVNYGLMPKFLSIINKKYKISSKSITFSTITTLIMILFFYLISYNIGYYGNIENAYAAMEISYAIYSLFYVLSLTIISITALKISNIIGKIIAVICLVILIITLYYSIANIFI